MMISICVRAPKNSGTLVPLMARLRKKGYRLSAQNVLSVDRRFVHYTLSIQSSNVVSPTEVTTDMHEATRHAGMSMLTMHPA